MATSEGIYAKMQASIKEYDRDAAIAAAKVAVAAGLDPVEALEKGFAEPIRELGQAFAEKFPTRPIACQGCQVHCGMLHRPVKTKWGEVWS